MLIFHNGVIHTMDKAMPHAEAVAVGDDGKIAAVGRLADLEAAAPGAERVLFPEYLTCEDKSEQLAAHVVHWLANADAREGLVAELAKLKARVGHGGASRLASHYILDVLDRRSTVPSPRPHYLPGMESDPTDSQTASARNSAA